MVAAVGCSAESNENVGAVQLLLICAIVLILWKNSMVGD